MKRNYLTILLLLLTINAHAKQSIGPLEYETYTGFGGPIVKLTKIYNHTNLMLGAKGAFLIDNSFYIGGAAYSIFNNNEYESLAIVHQKYHFSYAGGVVGYLYSPTNNLHINTQLLLGSAITFLYTPNDHQPIELSDADFSFVSEVEIGVLYDVNKFLKLELGVGYRYVHPSEFFTSGDLNGYSLNLGFWFGKY